MGSYDVLVRFRGDVAEWRSALFFVRGDVDLEGDRPIAALAAIAPPRGVFARPRAAVAAKRNRE
jgi:hypothetical protein